MHECKDTGTEQGPVFHVSETLYGSGVGKDLEIQVWYVNKKGELDEMCFCVFMCLPNCRSLACLLQSDDAV